MYILNILDFEELTGRMRKFQTIATTLRQRIPNIVLTTLPILAAVLTLFLAMFLSREHLFTLNRILILGLFGIAFNLAFGYTGLISFGHAAFFGLGAYTIVYVSNTLGYSLFMIIFVTMVLGTILAIVFGLVALRTSGVYFAMITLAIAQIFWIAANQTRVLGGEWGLMMTSSPHTILPLDVTNGLDFFIITLALFTATYLIFRKVINSPLGKIFQGIRENEDRTRSLGHKVTRYKLVSFIISGAFSSLAGALFAILFRYASPDLFFWVQSGDVLIISIIGGMYTLVGPLIGAAFWVVLRIMVTSVDIFSDHWQAFRGLIIVITVFLLPHGIAGIFSEGK
jgi:branched-chain amino acid transport system permease protein